MNELLLFLVLIIGSRAYANEIPRGPSNAMVQIEMFIDYQCPYTKRGYDNLNEIIKDDSLSVNFILKNFPLDFHDQAKHASKLAICSEEQNKFWEVSDAFFESQSKGQMTEQSLSKIIDIKKIDRKKLNTCLSGSNPDKNLDDDKRDAQKYKVMGTPYIIIHGPRGDRILSGAYPVIDIKKAINEVL